VKTVVDIATYRLSDPLEFFFTLWELLLVIMHHHLGSHFSDVGEKIAVLENIENMHTVVF
jgi:hypothetical protein